MVTVACVLRSGGIYRPEHVIALRRGVLSHLSADHRFVCLSDVQVPGVTTIKLAHNWPGWWSKLELFRPDLLFGRILYFDLDTVITGDLSDIAAYVGPMAMPSDFFRPAYAQSCVIAWEGGGEQARQVWETFVASPARHMERWGRQGDQAFIRDVVGNDRIVRFQDILPGQILSYKVHCRQTGQVPPGGRVVCAHGKPKPWDAEWNLRLPRAA